jgi:putative tryptophan/tyrosine transport system substrate-binding protein
MERTMNRRQLVTSLAATTLVRPDTLLAQSSRLRRIGVMLAIAETDPEGLHRVETFRRSLADEGWVDGQTVAIETRWYRGNFQIAQDLAKDLVDRGVEILMVNGTPGMDAVRALGTSIPVIFVVVSNPVGAGYVPNLSRPGGNVTGFSTFEPEIAGKWLQLLSQIVPKLKNVNMLLDPKFIGFNSLWRGLEEIAPIHGVTPHAAFASSLPEIERALDAMTRQEMPGLVVTPSPVNTVNRKRLIEIANQKRIPAIYPFRFYVQEGALIAYGFNAADQFKRAGGYVSRILKGEKAGDLPVQAPSLFELGINLKTAKAMGLAVPQSLLVGADEIIE